MKGRILLVEDEEAISTFVVTALSREGFSVQAVGTGEAALEMVDKVAPDLVVLDLMLPGMDGFEVCREIRKRPDYIPIVVLTAREEETDKVIGLELGADDYMAKPFSPRELVARIRAVLRLARVGRSEETTRKLIVDQGMEIDVEGRVLLVHGKPIELTAKEFNLLLLLATNRGRVFGREALLEQVWGYDYLGESRTVDVHVQRLRSKIEPDSGRNKYILTVRTVGYKFAPSSAEP